MFKVFYNAWKVKELRKKMLYTLMVMAIVRLGTHIPLPALDVTQLSQGGSNLLYSIISGGSGSRYSIFAMGIGPYISSSIIMQLLTIAIPRLEQMQKEGEEGRNKIQSYSRYLTVILALIQGAGLTYTMKGAFAEGYQNYLYYTLSVVSLIAGTTLIMWLAEAITKNGVGNGSSMIIFINIISNLPMAISFFVNFLFKERSFKVDESGNIAISESGTIEMNPIEFDPKGLIIVIGLLVAFLIVIAFAVVIQQGERRIPVQYSKKMVGRKQYGGQSSFIPIKVNTAGVISIIFALSLLQFPETVGQFFSASRQEGTILFKMIQYLKINNPVGAVLYVLLIFLFTFFYTSIVMNPQEMAENMKKNGGFIPGIRPGSPTTNYIKNVLDRITVVGGVAYALIALVPILIQWILRVDNVGFGGTTVLIVVGVALDTVKALESQLLMRHYKGFLND